MVSQEILEQLEKPLPTNIELCHEMIKEMRDIIRNLFQIISKFEKLPMCIEQLERDNVD